MDLLDSCPFSLLKQSSLAKEKVSQNGLQKVVHVVVKNQPFVIQVKMDSSRVREKVELAKVTLETQLLYDLDNLKEVSYVKVKPLESKSHRGGEHGEILTVEIKIKVLSSQLEDSFFRIKLIPFNSSTKHPISNSWGILSEPIKVVSKPEQVRKKKSPLGALDEAEQQDSPTPKPKEPHLGKRERTELIIQHLGQIEAVCQQQQLLLSQLCDTSATNKDSIQNLCPPSAPQFLPLESFQLSPTLQEGKKEKALSALQQFEMAFQIFLQSSSTLSVEEQPHKIRKLFRNQSKQDLGIAEEFVSQANAIVDEQRMVPNTELSSFPGCDCPNCPHKHELDSIFANDLISPAPIQF